LKFKRLLICRSEIHFTMIAVLFAFALSALPQIVFNPPNVTRGYGYAKTLSLRHSERAFADTKLSTQDLGDLIWSAVGINRPDTGLLTTPTAVDAQDVNVYAVFPEGIYVYDRSKHVLNGVVEGDYRSIVADSQPTLANAPVFLLLVSDLSNFGFLVDDSEKHRLGALDTGVAAGAIQAFAAANGFVTVPRAVMDTAQLSKLLSLSSTQLLHLNLPIGYPA
jgi:hypothetical protein